MVHLQAITDIRYLLKYHINARGACKHFGCKAVSHFEVFDGLGQVWQLDVLSRRVVRDQDQRPR